MLFFIESIAFFMGMIQQLTPTPLKGPTATSPRQRLGGENWEQISALQGQLKCKAKGRAELVRAMLSCSLQSLKSKSIKRGRAFALTARPSHAPYPPRAMPWAMSGLAFQAALYPKGPTTVPFPKKNAQMHKENGHLSVDNVVRQVESLSSEVVVHNRL